jgi:predicted transcriptional regulator
MIISELLESFRGKIINQIYNENKDYSHAFGSDLMSDVLAFIKNEDTFLVTGLINSQVIRTAEMIDLKLIIFVRGKMPSDEVIQMASENEITLISTNLSLFSVSGILYNSGIKGLEIGE